MVGPIPDSPGTSRLICLENPRPHLLGVAGSLKAEGLLGKAPPTPPKTHPSAGFSLRLELFPHQAGILTARSHPPPRPHLAQIPDLFQIALVENSGV